VKDVEKEAETNPRDIVRSPSSVSTGTQTPKRKRSSKRKKREVSSSDASSTTSPTFDSSATSATASEDDKIVVNGSSNKTSVTAPRPSEPYQSATHLF